MKQFNELGLAEPILRAVLAEGYTEPTPIQAQVIPAMLAGHDIVGTAQTGTGKTAAFVLPLLDRLRTEQHRPDSRCCRVLILAPTRELASQIADSVRTYGKFIRHSVAVIVGGVRPGPQIKALSRGVDIVVATPGRLLDHMSTGAIRLDATTTVILDEGDQMLDLGFMPAIRRLMAKLPRNRQTLLLSATMPKQIRALADDFLKNPREIAVAQHSRPIDKIDQKVVLIDREGKRGALVELLKGSGVERAIVFTRTKRGADKVQVNLQKSGLAAAAIHGNKSQGQRDRTLAAFRSGSVPILVATDIAARGIDVDGVSHVVNFELPNVPEAYVHRIGRTARAGHSGIAVSFCDSSERGLLRDIEKLIGRSLNAKRTDGTTRAASADGEPAGGSPGAAVVVPGGEADAPRSTPPQRPRKHRGKRRPGNPGNPGGPGHRGEAKSGHATADGAGARKPRRGRRWKKNGPAPLRADGTGPRKRGGGAHSA